MDDDLDDYKLDATWGQDPSYVVHASFERDRRHGGRKVRVENKWFRHRELGVGSCGVVHFESTADGRERAVKTIRKSVAARLKIDYRRELAAISTFSRAKYQQHQIFVEFLGWFENPEFIFLAMEYFPLGDLSKHISEDINEYELKDISSQLLEGLRLMHSKGFTHRDLKPQNIFVVQIQPSWWVKIGDFGISKRVRDCDATELRTATGTQGYEAPEIRGYIEVDEDEPSSVYTNVVDMWSFGCVIYKVVVKHVPFQNGREIKRFCDNRIPFPAQDLQDKMTTIGIDFLRSTLVAKPSDRPSAEVALKHPWLVHGGEDNTSSPQYRLALPHRKEHGKAAADTIFETEAVAEMARQGEDEEKMERQIRHMEEENALVEKPEADVLARRAAAKAAAESLSAKKNKLLPEEWDGKDMFSPKASVDHPSGAFPSNNSITRTPSSSYLGHIVPRLGRQQIISESQRSKHYPHKNTTLEAQAAMRMPLTASQEVKPLQVSSAGWKPQSVLAQSSTIIAASLSSSAENGHMNLDIVRRKVRAALNKITSKNFDKIANRILAITAQSKDEADCRTLRQVIQLIFEKAIGEAHWSSIYAKLCKGMLESMSPDIRDESILDKNGNIVSGGNLFRRIFINRCQEEFERGWNTEGGEEKTADEAILSSQYYVVAAAKHRSLGLPQFMGELYKIGMLTERIINECLRRLVDFTGQPDEVEIESLTKLLKNIGGNLDASERGRLLMDAYFSRIQFMINILERPSRLKFMLMDIVDLREKNWPLK